MSSPPRVFANDTTQDINQPVDFEKLDPLKIGGSENIVKNTGPAVDENGNTLVLNDPGKIITRVLQFAIPIAGLILFVMIVWGGFEMLSGAATAKSQEAGQQRITAAVVGFFLLFAAYWIAQIIQAVFGIQVL